jgi:hypothetical protein
MAGWVDSVQISVSDGPAYEQEAGALAILYGELLGMERYDPGYIKLARPDGTPPEIGFESGTGEPRPRWPDPSYPQQAHIDIDVRDPGTAARTAVRLGATVLRDEGAHVVLADNVGHPFCLYENRSIQHDDGRIARVVFDCPDPLVLASFYAELLDMPSRVVETPELVVIEASGGRGPRLAFQRAVFPAARWPDPAFPAQVHLDLTFEDLDDGLALIERLGGTRLTAGEFHSVYADPASHPMCLCTPAPAEWRDEQWAKRPRHG